jgi:DNA polymerase elongation subunit (family B)
MRGWILDVYPEKTSISAWLKLEDGSVRKITERWNHSIFVASESISELKEILRNERIINSLSSYRFVSRYERITDNEPRDVLQLYVLDNSLIKKLADEIEGLGPLGKYRLYNVDVPSSQLYLYEKDIFPLAYCEASQRNSYIEWNILDDVWSLDYSIPPVKSIFISVKGCKSPRLLKDEEKLKGISIEFNEEKIDIESSSEEKILTELVSTVKQADPDFIFTDGGDRYIFPYIIKRAEKNNFSLILGRENEAVKIPSKKGTSFFSYGKILFKPSPVKLFGRIHIDLSNSFVYDESGFDGLFEVSRVCRLPLHTASRASIGKALSSLEMYHATKRKILIPWKPSIGEIPKSRLELLKADRGGLILEPKTGIFENVAELDFSSLYPNIMMKKNISAETVKCSCCKDSKNRVPELGWNVCEKRIGIVPESIEIIIKKRAMYKELKRNASGLLREVYERRQIALKWLGVTSFGYLGFNNAKFGRIDAHIAVCAWDRKILTDAMRIAESKGFRIIHGIVDSLWVYCKDIDESKCIELKEEIEKETCFDVSFEGIYRWIAFLPSKVDRRIPVVNRYFGVYRDGKIKVRGIEARRKDTPEIVRRLQMEILSILARANTIEEAKNLIPECIDLLKRYESLVKEKKVEAEELVITRTLSKSINEYRNKTLLVDAARKLEERGLKLNAGEDIDYVVIDEDAKLSSRASTLELLQGSLYDESYYIKMMRDACKTVLEPFSPSAL